jgi:hypothetical protein
VIVCAPGKALLYLGSPAGLRDGGKLADPRGAAAGSFGQACAGVGDLDGDGYADVAVTGADTSLLAFIYYGGPHGLRSGTATLNAGSASGHSADELTVGPAGDVDGDGYTDLFVAGPAGLHLHRGGSGGVASAASITMAGTFGAAAGIGDADGDGYADVVVAPGACATPVQILAGSMRDLTPVYDFPRVTFPSCPAPLLAR